MAMNEASEAALPEGGTKSSEPAPPPRAEVPARAGESAPGWLLGLYLGGLALVYVGERVLSGLEKGAGVVSILGLLCVLAATLLRFSPRFRGGGERRAIETLLAGLSVVGLVGLGLYFLSSPAGAERFFGNMEEVKRTNVVDLLTVIWVSLIAIAVLPMIFAETALRPMRSSERPEGRRVRAATLAGLTLSLALIYGALFVYAADGIGWKVDYSYFKTSRPSEATRKLAASLGEPVKVTAFFPEVNDVGAEVKSYLTELAKGMPKLEVKVTDRLLVPKLAKELRATKDGVIVLSRGTTNHSIDIGTELEPARAKLKTLDRDFQEQLLKLAKARMTAYLTVGHGELTDQPRGAASDNPARTGNIVRTLLTRQNYQVKELGLGQGLASSVPDDADVVMILGPTEPFTSEEIETLKRYAAQGGKLIIAVDADGVSTKSAAIVTGGAAEAETPAPKPSAKPAGSAAPASSAEPAPPAIDVSADIAFLDSLTELVGLKFSGDVLAHERQHVALKRNDSDRTRLVSTSFSSHASVSTLSRNAPRAAVIVFGAGSLEKMPSTTAKIDFVVRAASGTFADKNRNFKNDKNVDKSGSFNLAAAVTQPITMAPEPKKEEPKKDDKAPAKKEEPKEMRAFVIADADALTDFVMGEVVSNQVMFLDAVRWLVGEESLMGEQKTEEDVKIERTKQQDLTWFYASIFGAPLLVMAAGVLISRRSKRARGGKA